MKKFVIFILTFILYSPPVWADMSDHGRLSDIPGYHGNDGFG